MKPGILTFVSFIAFSMLKPPGLPAAQAPVSFPTTDGGTVSGDLYGSGNRGLVMVAHGGYSSRPSWEKQAQAFMAAGFRVLVFETRPAVQLRLMGKESACLYDPLCMSRDVLAAIRYMRAAGATTVSVIAGSAGGGAAAQASVEARPGEIHRLVLLAPMVIDNPERMQGRKLFITARDDRSGDGLRLPGIRDQFDRTPEPKKLIILDGSAHAQRIFDTPDGERVTREILQFLNEP